MNRGIFASYVFIAVRLLLGARLVSYGGFSVAYGISEMAIGLLNLWAVTRPGARVDDSRAGMMLGMLYLAPLCFEYASPNVLASLLLPLTLIQWAMRAWMWSRCTIGAPVFVSVLASGPWALIRHPLSLLEMVMCLTYAAGHLSAWNVAVGLWCVLALMLTVKVEERFLFSHREYRDYAAAVRSRWIPGVW